MHKYVELGHPEPDWKEVECGVSPNFERCSHMAWYHNLVPRTNNLSTRTFLGRVPLEFHDVIGFIIKDKRYKATGNGGNSDYLYASRGTKYPTNVWIATVQAGNGKRMEFPVANITKDGYAPFKGVQREMPPTRNNPQETIVGVL